MRNLLILSAIATTGIAGEVENPMWAHTFSPKGFYRYHKEGNYTYKTGGVGFEYQVNPEVGFGFKVSSITNFKKDNALVETENNLFYKFIVNNNHSVYPILATTFSSHQVEHENKSEDLIVLVRDVFINKFTAFAGLGWEIVPDNSFRFRVEGFLFRDLHNALMMQENDRFWGRSYSNPSGFKAKIGFIAKITDRFYADLAGHYTQTFEKCYKELGSELALRWGF